MMTSNPLDRVRATAAKAVKRIQHTWDKVAGRGSEWRVRGDATREETYLAALRSPVASERWQAAAGLGRSAHRSREAIAALVGALGDPEQFVRWHAAEALAKQEQGGVFHLLAETLDDAEPLRRAGAAEALGKLGGDGAALLLVKKIGDSSPEVRVAVAEALGELRDPTTASALLPQLHDHDEGVMQAAARALGRIGNPVAAPFLAEALGGPGHSVLTRRALTAALVRAGHPDAQTALLAALNDEDPQVRAYAANALGQVGNEMALESLAALKADKHKLIRGTVSDRATRAIDLLERRGRRAGPPVETATEQAPAVPEVAGNPDDPETTEED